MTRRTYSGEIDRQLMVSLVHRTRPDNLHVIDLPYRLCSWAFDYPENIGLWVDDSGQLVAWAVLQTPFWTIDYAYHETQATQDALPLLLAWAEERIRSAVDSPSGHPTWFIDVYEDHTESIAPLEAAGFACQGIVPVNPWSKVYLQRSPYTPVPAASRPTGFHIRPLNGEAEIDACVEVHRSAFGSKNMTPEWRRRILQCPEYRHELDLVVVTDDGRLAAYCLFWFDAIGINDRPGGQIEPLAVRPDFQRLGLGRALLREGIERLHRLGAEIISVETDNERTAALGFYQSVGFSIVHNILVYRKDYMP